MVLVLWRIEFALFLVESRGYRVEGRGVVVFIHLFIQFFFLLLGRTAMADSMAWQNFRKNLFKKRNHS